MDDWDVALNKREVDAICILSFSMDKYDKVGKAVRESCHMVEKDEWNLICMNTVENHSMKEIHDA